MTDDGPAKPAKKDRSAVFGIAGMLLVLFGIPLAVLAVKGHKSPAQRQAEAAVARYHFLEKQKADSEALCAAARDVQEIYTNQQDAAGYDEWQSRADLECLDAGYARRRKF